MAASMDNGSASSSSSSSSMGPGTMLSSGSSADRRERVSRGRTHLDQTSLRHVDLLEGGLGRIWLAYLVCHPLPLREPECLLNMRSHAPGSSSFEPFIHVSSALSSASHHLGNIQHIHSNPITGTASNVLSCDVPGVSKYNPLSRSRVGRDKSNRDGVPEYQSRVDVSLTASDRTNVDTFLRIETGNSNGIATLEQRWIDSWTSSVLPKSVQSVVRLVIVY